MEVNGIHILFLEDLRWQHLQNKKALHFQVPRQELVAIGAAGDHLSYPVILEALANFPQSGKGRFRIAQPVERAEATIERQPYPLVQPAAQDVPDPAD